MMVCCVVPQKCQAVMLRRCVLPWKRRGFTPFPADSQPTRPRNVPVSDLWAFTKPLMWRVRYLEDGLPADVSN